MSYAHSNPTDYSQIKDNAPTEIDRRVPNWDPQGSAVVEHSKRSFFVSAVAWIEMGLGGVTSLVALVATFASLMNGAIGPAVFGTVYFLCAVPMAYCGYGVWRRKEWGRRGSTILAGLGAVSGAVWLITAFRELHRVASFVGWERTLAMEGARTALFQMGCMGVGIVLYLVILWGFTRQSVKEEFGVLWF